VSVIVTLFIRHLLGDVNASRVPPAAI